jgi:hypothetical protein
MGRAEVRRTHGRVGRAFQPVLRKQRRARPKAWASLDDPKKGDQGEHKEAAGWIGVKAILIVAVPVTPTGRPLAATHPIPGRRPREWGATLGGKGVEAQPAPTLPDARNPGHGGGGAQCELTQR